MGGCGRGSRGGVAVWRRVTLRRTGDVWRGCVVWAAAVEQARAAGEFRCRLPACRFAHKALAHPLEVLPYFAPRPWGFTALMQGGSETGFSLASSGHHAFTVKCAPRVGLCSVWFHCVHSQVAHKWRTHAYECVPSCAS